MSDLNPSGSAAGYDLPLITNPYEDVLDTLRENMKRLLTGTGPAVTTPPGTAAAPGLAFAPGTGFSYTPNGVAFSWAGTPIFTLVPAGVAMPAGTTLVVTDTPTEATHAVNKGYVDGLFATGPFLPLAGGAVSGNLAVGGALTVAGSGVWTAANFDPGAKATIGGDVSFNAVTVNTLTASGNVSSAGASYAANWFRTTAADTGLYSDIHGIGVQLKSGRVDIYGGATYFGCPTVLASGAVYSYYSDDRLKERLLMVQAACARLARLDAFIYKHNALAKSLGFTDDEEHIGLSAQQVKREIPQAVARAPFDTDDNGKSKSGEDYLTIAYERIVPVLVAAVNELNARVSMIEQPVLKK
jgi:hypothetical protein